MVTDESESGTSSDVFRISVSGEAVHCITCHLDCIKLKAELNYNMSYAAVTCNKAHFPALYIVPLDPSTKSTILHSQEQLRLVLQI